MNLIKSKLYQFSQLEDGWHYGEGVKFSPQFMDFVSGLVDKFESSCYNQLDVFPGTNGSMQMAVYMLHYDEHISVDIDIEPELTYSIYLDLGYANLVENSVIDLYNILDIIMNYFDEYRNTKYAAA